MYRDRKVTCCVAYIQRVRGESSRTFRSRVGGACAQTDSRMYAYLQCTYVVRTMPLPGASFFHVRITTFLNNAFFNNLFITFCNHAFWYNSSAGCYFVCRVYIFLHSCFLIRFFTCDDCAILYEMFLFENRVIVYE